MRRNYHGSDHLGAAADYEEHLEPKNDQPNVITPSKASILATEAISMEEVKEDDEQEGIGNSPVRADGVQQQEEIQTRLSGTGEQPLRAPVESSDQQVVSDQDFVRNPSAVAPGYVPSEHDESILLEIPASMVRPLRVLRGMYQVSFPHVGYDVQHS